MAKTRLMEGLAPLVYLDANVLIYLVEAEPAHRTLVEQQLKALETQGARFMSSELTLTEVLVHPLRTGNDKLVKIYEALFAGFVQAEPISRQVHLLAAQQRADTPSRRMPDAIHIATALLAGAGLFVTGDKGIKGLPAALELITL